MTSESTRLFKTPTGIEGFDQITGGGLPRGRPSLVCGAAGCGKTLFGMEFLVHGATAFGEPGIFVSFEESADELISNVSSLGFDVPALIEGQKIAIDHIHLDRSEIQEAGEYDLEGLFLRIGYAADTIGAKRIVLDTIEVLFSAFSNEALLRAEDRAADRLETFERAQANLKELEASIAETDTPTEEDLEEARTRRDRLKNLRDARPIIKSLSAEHSKLTDRVAALLEELEELASVSYDAEAHGEKRQEKTRLERALGRVEELERRLATRPEIEKTLAEARKKGEEAGTAAEELREKVSALGFDETAYETALDKVSAAEERVATLRDAREQLGGQWKDVDHRIERAQTELKRLDDDRKLANEKATAASRMDEMDGLFTEFFRSLTARARPMLEIEASNLIRDLTDGRYERMEFDENYRVRLLDRFDDSYAIERFSGGEADVASLSARVALSRIVASRGGNTLGFLVLDEVFGSLDAGRRNNVLLALERLKRSFGQIFIISHVPEVQESALVDEVWMLEEDEDGKSTVRRVESGTSGLLEILESTPGS